jgi:protocatechuate 3,4-dioxygenase beta subunit
MNRRSFVKNSSLTAISIAAFGSLQWNGKSFEGDTETTSDVLGPFYRPGAPMRHNLVVAGTKAATLQLSGTVFGKDGKTPLSNVLVEIWHCDENEVYDNASDEYRYRGSAQTGKDGRYSFKTIIPVPYKDGDDWRPAHIHMRISSADHQDLITQIYFKGQPHIDTDPSASARQSANRILDIRKSSANESAVKFDIVMGKTLRLDDAAYKKITGLYKLNQGMAEFTREDDLLVMKLNGQLLEGMTFRGNNKFEGGLGFNRAQFAFSMEGETKVSITLWDMGPVKKFLETYEGVKYLKYGK